jgi:hypothetical protein
MHHLSPRRSRLLAVVTAGGLALGLSALATIPAAAAPTAASVTLTATPDATVGDPVRVSAAVLGVTDVYSYAVTFAFDPAVLSYTGGNATAGRAGGFDAVSTSGGTVTVLHSRLGTSPPIAGDLPLALDFATIASGDATITASVSLVDAGGVSVALPAAASARVVIAAAPVVVPPVVPSASPTPPPTPAVAGSAAPVAPAASGAVRRDADGSLAFTGLDTGVLAGVALVALAAVATGLVVARRRTAGPR